MKKIIALISLILIIFIGYIYKDISNNTIDDRNKLTNQMTCLFGDEKSCSVLIWRSDNSEKEKVKKLTQICDKTAQVDACSLVANIYAFGSSYSTEINATKALYYYDKACRKREESVFKFYPCRRIANAYEDGFFSRDFTKYTDPIFSIKKNLKKSIFYREFNCRNKSFSSCYYLANKFLDGDYRVKQSSLYHKISASTKEKVAEKYLRIGCNYTHMTNEEVAKSRSCYLLLKLDIENNEKSKIYDLECTYNTTQSSSYDHGESCFKNGLLYLEGKGLRQNFKKAKEYFGKACDIGNEDGCSEYIKLNHH